MKIHVHIASFKNKQQMPSILVMLHILSLTCALEVISSRCWSVITASVSTGSLSQGSRRPGPPRMVRLVSSTSLPYCDHNYLFYITSALSTLIEFNLPLRMIPEDIHSKTLLSASPGLCGPVALLIAFSTSNSIACNNKKTG